MEIFELIGKPWVVFFFTVLLSIGNPTWKWALVSCPMDFFQADDDIMMLAFAEGGMAYLA